MTRQSYQRKYEYLTLYAVLVNRTNTIIKTIVFTIRRNSDNLLNDSDINEINAAMNEIRHFEEDHDLIDEFIDDLSD